MAASSEDMQQSSQPVSLLQAHMFALLVQELADLLSRLLVRKPAYRLGALAGGAEDIKKHPWFATFDWEAFKAKKLKPPYMPKVTCSCACMIKHQQKVH